ncbi:MAG TPA: hypothetical protein VM683_15430, partial [Anaeromyxobacteraceae bacterium]|nr:hypothetical protein [Anaeromyxobacteraceae bacterium]
MFEERHGEAAAVTDGWRALAAAEHLAGVLRKAEAVCGATMVDLEAPGDPRRSPSRLEVGAAWERLVAEAASR